MLLAVILLEESMASIANGQLTTFQKNHTMLLLLWQLRVWICYSQKPRLQKDVPAYLQGQAGWSPGQSGLVENVPAHGRLGWNEMIFRILSDPNHSMNLWFFVWDKSAFLGTPPMVFKMPGLQRSVHWSLKAWAPRPVNPNCLQEFHVLNIIAVCDCRRVGEAVLEELVSISALGVQNHTVPQMSIWKCTEPLGSFCRWAHAGTKPILTLTWHV